jgi:hypothetical protein
MDDFREWCRSERARLHHRLGQLESGKLKIAHDEGSGWVDRTEEWRAEIFRRMSELDEMLGGGALEWGD